MRHALISLPTYDLGPGRDHDEFVVNIVIYGMLTGLLLALGWIGWLVVRAGRDEQPGRRTQPVLSRSPDSHHEAIWPPGLTDHRDRQADRYG